MKDYFFNTQIVILVSRQESGILKNLVIYEPWILDKLEGIDWFEDCAWLEFDWEEIEDLESALQAHITDSGLSLGLKQLLEKIQHIICEYNNFTLGY